MSSETVTVEVSLAWWAVPYINTLAFFCNLMGAEPDWEKVERVIRRAIRTKVVS